MELGDLTTKAHIELVKAVENWSGCKGSYAADARESALAAWAWFKLLSDAEDGACRGKQSDLADALNFSIEELEETI